MKKSLCATLSIFLIAFILVGCKSNVSDKQMTITIGNNMQRTGTYTGEIENDIPNGKGKFTSANPQNITWVYEGEFKDGTFNGQGKQTMNTMPKQVIEGTYKNGKLVKGKEFLNNQLRYDGEWENGIPNGTGTIYNADGSTFYQGDVKNGFPALPAVDLNQNVSYADWQYQATAVSTANSAGNKAPKGVFVIVTMHVTNNGSTARQFAASDNPFILIDENGKQYPMDTDALLAYRINNSVGDWYLSKINPSFSANLPLIFDVPKGLTGVQLLPARSMGKANPINIGDIN
ncbi:DUF4352 domain-containing protein [Megasphaera cerevisiae]|uniref:DUF4352 domain-containing protein n=1 Tax=Megasphaera cerevisiae TaxID=39029 RepID=UPI00065AC1F3|nr:DUF4352 domain-containing protein [Megasphaera cerevisiae]SKA23103.1 MORN repeat-containing protein [Megasphaera cerevisiae DSM 20462]